MSQSLLGMYSAIDIGMDADLTFDIARRSYSIMPLWLSYERAQLTYPALATDCCDLLLSLLVDRLRFDLLVAFTEGVQRMAKPLRIWRSEFWLRGVLNNVPASVSLSKHEIIR